MNDAKPYQLQTATNHGLDTGATVRTLDVDARGVA